MLDVALGDRVRRRETGQPLTVADLLERDEQTSDADQRMKRAQHIAAAEVEALHKHPANHDAGEVSQRGQPFDQAVLAHREQIEGIVRPLRELVAEQGEQQDRRHQEDRPFEPALRAGKGSPPAPGHKSSQEGDQQEQADAQPGKRKPPDRQDRGLLTREDPIGREMSAGEIGIDQGSDQQAQCACHSTPGPHQAEHRQIALARPQPRDLLVRSNIAAPTCRRGVCWPLPHHRGSSVAGHPRPELLSKNCQNPS